MNWKTKIVQFWDKIFGKLNEGQPAICVSCSGDNKLTITLNTTDCTVIMTQQNAPIRNDGVC